jgi:hypothetical protein
MVTGESHFKVELERLRGEVLRKTDDAAEAASWFRRALATARSQQAKSRSSCALRPASRASGATKASGARPMTCSPPSTAGSLRASTPPI